jgi:hypothetical protein
VDYQSKKPRIVSKTYGLWGMTQAMGHARILQYWRRKHFAVEHQDTHAIENTLWHMCTDYGNLYLR